MKHLGDLACILAGQPSKRLPGGPSMPTAILAARTHQPRPLAMAKPRTQGDTPVWLTALHVHTMPLPEHTVVVQPRPDASDVWHAFGEMPRRSMTQLVQ